MESGPWCERHISATGAGPKKNHFHHCKVGQEQFPLQSPRKPSHQPQGGAGAPRELHCSSTGAGQEVQPLETPQTSQTPAARNSRAGKAGLSPSVLKRGKCSPWGQHRGTSRAPDPSTTHGPQPGTLPAAQPRVSAASLRAFRFAFQTCQSRLLPSRHSQMWLNCFSQNFPNTKFQPKADAAHRKFFPPKLRAKS